MSELEQRLEDWLLFVEERMDQERSREEIAEELEAKSEKELFREGAGPSETERYQSTGDYEVQVAGLMRFVSKQREKQEPL